jgi:phosphate starvation-inducible membrane PsiE
MHRFLRTSGRLPLRFLINSGITVIVIVVLLANAVGSPFDPQLGPVAAAATLRLFIGAEIFMLTFEEFFADSKPAKRKLK